MKKNLLFLALIPFALSAQNLVPNPGFETQTSCPLVSEIRKAPPWNAPSLGTPDLFNTTCPQQNGHGRTGIGCSGIYVIGHFPDNREYIQTRLTSPLQSGKTYCVEFYVQRESFFRYACDRMGAYFSHDSVFMQQTDWLAFTPQVQNPAGNLIVSGTLWTRVSGSFIASGGESFILIGNFYDDAHSVRDSINTGSDAGYYNIDDISVTQCVTGIDEIADGALKVYPNPANDILVTESLEDIESMKIYSVTGSLMLEDNNATDRHREINISAYPVGVYLLMISSPGGSLVRRFSVAH